MDYHCPRDGTILEGTMLDSELWCPLEEEYIPNRELVE